MSAPNRHRFPQHCIDLDALIQGRTLESYLRALANQANDEAATRTYLNGVCGTDVSEHRESYASPEYFGEGGEFLRHCFFDFFGSRFCLRDIWSVNARSGVIQRDRGWDGGAVTSKSHRNHDWASKGDPVYIQDKTTRNFSKLYETNDGSRIMNFVGAAAMDAIVQGHAQKARFILWTTGKGLHYILEQNVGERLEVVGYEAISNLVDYCDDFWKSVAMNASASGEQTS